MYYVCDKRGDFMYSGTYPEKSSGAVKAFEDAFAREEFLRRSAGGAEQNTCTGKTARPAEEKEEDRKICLNAEKAVSDADSGRKKGLSALFGGIDTGDLILILLIVFFLLDGDSENDKAVPILLAVLLLI